MRLSEKVDKMGTGKAYEGALRRFRRASLPQHLGLPVDAERLIHSIDAGGFAEIKQRYSIENPCGAWPKYLDLPVWMTKNLQRVKALGLDSGPRRRILDLGCGAGYFLYICQWLGHDVLGLDIDEVPMFGEMLALLGLDRALCRIEPFRRLPRLRHQFDLITAFMICFNGHKSPGLWTQDEWGFFLDDLNTQLAPGGRICLGFNHEKDGTCYSQELQSYFLWRGARIEENRVLFARDPEFPVTPGMTVAQFEVVPIRTRAA